MHGMCPNFEDGWIWAPLAWQGSLADYWKPKGTRIPWGAETQQEVGWKWLCISFVCVLPASKRQTTSVPPAPGFLKAAVCLRLCDSLPVYSCLNPKQLTLLSSIWGHRFSLEHSMEDCCEHDWHSESFEGRKQGLGNHVTEKQRRCLAWKREISNHPPQSHYTRAVSQCSLEAFLEGGGSAPKKAVDKSPLSWYHSIFFPYYPVAL